MSLTPKTQIIITIIFILISFSAGYTHAINRHSVNLDESMEFIDKQINSFDTIVKTFGITGITRQMTIDDALNLYATEKTDVQIIMRAYLKQICQLNITKGD